MPERRLYVRICGQGRRGGGISPARCAAGDQARRESRRHRDPDVAPGEHHALRSIQADSRSDRHHRCADPYFRRHRRCRRPHCGPGSGARCDLRDCARGIIMRRRAAVSVAGVLLGVGASYQGALADTAELSAIVVTATRVAESSRDLPVSIDRVDRAALAKGQLQVNLSESLITVPGVSVQSRQNYAQDLQLSVRGFGARSSFGVRGIRLYSDGIPGTMPDGQGQFSQFDLGSADHIEVLRGPFSALYGNSSGGVIAIFTEDAKPGYLLDGKAEYGTFNTQRYALKTGGDDRVVNYVVDAAHFQTDGYRFHSDAERNNFNAKLRFGASETSTVTVVANAIETPFVQDPLGLTRAQLAANPEQAGTGAIPFNTRKSLGQEQLGLVFDDKLSGNDEVIFYGYGDHRATTQYQAIPQATQQNAPLYPGGVIDLDRAFWGA